jgi:hypothetical protein
MTPIMQCGHAANAKHEVNGKMKDVCVICYGIDPGASRIYENPPSMEGRIAVCSCGKEVPSNSDLPFFAFLGNKEHCAHCAFVSFTHASVCEINPTTKRKNDLNNHDYEPVIGYPNDRFYCGHAGWD